MRVFNLPYRVFLLALVTVVILWASFWITVVNLPILADLDQRGVTTQAEIVWKSDPYRRWRGHQSNSGGIRQDIRYGFYTASGDWIEGTANRKERYSQSLTVGRRFEVTYLPDRPEVFHSDLFKGYAGFGMVKALLILAACTALVTLYMTLRMPRDWTGPALRPILSFHHTEWWETS